MYSAGHASSYTKGKGAMMLDGYVKAPSRNHFSGRGRNGKGFSKGKGKRKHVEERGAEANSEEKRNAPPIVIAQREARQRFERSILDRIQGRWVDESNFGTTYVVENNMCSVSNSGNDRVFRNRLGVYGVDMCWNARIFWHILNIEALNSSGEKPDRLEWNPAKDSPPAQRIVWLKALDEKNSSMHISVISGGKSQAMTFTAEPSETVRELQTRVAEAIGASPHLRRQLLHGVTVLPLDLSLGAVGIQNGDLLVYTALPLCTALTAARDGTVKVWNAESGECIRSFSCHEDSDDDDGSDRDGRFECVNMAQFSKDSAKVLIACVDGNVKILDTETGACITTVFVGDEGGVTSVVFSPDGASILTGGADGNVKIWSALSGECTQTFTTDANNSCKRAVFSADGDTVLAAFADNTTQAWNTKTREVTCLPPEFAEGEDSVLFTAGGEFVLVASTTAAKIWNTKQGKYTQTFAQDKALRFAVFSADATVLLTASCDGVAQVWNVKTGKCTQSLCPEPDPKGFRPAMASAAFSADSSFVLTCSADDNFPAAHIWEADTGKCVQTLLGHRRAGMSVAFAR